MVQLASLQSPAELGGAAGQHVRRGDMICGLEFSLDGQMLATAGVSKQVALYALAALTQQQQQQQPQPDWPGSTCSGSRHKQEQDSLPSLPPVALVRLPGKVSSIAWSPDMDGVMSIGDYDGTLTQVHVASGHYLTEVDAHCGRRIWSVAHSRLRPHLAATASDDCSAKLWAGSAFDSPVTTITLPGAPAVCCADFSQHDANLLALAAADARVYLYDLRQLAQPLAVLRGHSRPVSYAKFFGAQQLVSASIDGTLAAWDLVPALGQAVSSSSSSSIGQSSSSSTSMWPGTSSSWQGPAQAQQQQVQQQLSQPWKVFKGHTNAKNFVGLAVHPCAGLMAVGSETGEVFAYHTSWSDPLARHRLDAAPAHGVQQLAQPAAVAWSRQLQQRSACAVAWQPSVPGCSSSGGGGAGSFGPSALLAAANSAGECKLLALVDP
ncbi:WD40-repeat-containing domain protein [Scenedesmus sp. NREL 46B-D3]|nr:WD40-repeat-containing domain protein [Scenedesmus sp. NREL 46B-D3]